MTADDPLDDGNLLLHWYYRPHPMAPAFIAENTNPETLLNAEFLAHFAAGSEPRVELRRDEKSCPAAMLGGHGHELDDTICWRGWLLNVDADNGRVVYRIGDYDPELNSWSARWPD